MISILCFFLSWFNFSQSTYLYSFKVGTKYMYIQSNTLTTKYIIHMYIDIHYTNSTHILMKHTRKTWLLCKSACVVRRARKISLILKRDSYGVIMHKCVYCTYRMSKMIVFSSFLSRLNVTKFCPFYLIYFNV